MLNRTLPFSYEKAHFIRDIVPFLYLTPVDRISPSKKERNPYVVVCLLRHLAGSEQHCLKILNYHMEKVKLKKKNKKISAVQPVHKNFLVHRCFSEFTKWL